MLKESLLFSQGDTKYLVGTDTDGQTIYMAYWYINGGYVATDWRGSLTELIDVICDPYGTYGDNDTNANQIANCMWFDMDHAPAVSKGKRVDKALNEFLKLEEVNPSETRKYKSLADFEMEKGCY